MPIKPPNEEYRGPELGQEERNHQFPNRPSGYSMHAISQHAISFLQPAIKLFRYTTNDVFDIVSPAAATIVEAVHEALLKSFDKLFSWIFI